MLVVALAIYAIELRGQAGYRLRSRCDLIPVEAQVEIVGPSGARTTKLEATEEALKDAVKAAKAAGFRWGQRTELKASEKLQTLLKLGHGASEGD